MNEIVHVSIGEHVTESDHDPEAEYAEHDDEVEVARDHEILAIAADCDRVASEGTEFEELKNKLTEGTFVAGLFEDNDVFHVGQVKKICDDTCIITFMKRVKRGDDRYRVFPSTEDCHELRYTSILNILPQVDVEIRMCTSRLIVMGLHNFKIIRNWCS